MSLLWRLPADLGRQRRDVDETRDDIGHMVARAIENDL
jgi:hypothetical protein